MVARGELKQLYAVLIDTRFGFMGHDEHELAAIYSSVKRRYGELCNDSYLCCENCRSGNRNPEWHHTVRSALNSLRKLGHVSRGHRRSFWVI
jgi:hypothetical protein